MKLILAVLVTLVLVQPSWAQCGGNGGEARLSTTPMAIGTVVTVNLSGLPNASWWLFTSGAPAVFPVPGFGTVCLDPFHPLFGVLLSGTLSPAGQLALPVPIANDPVLLPFTGFIQAVASDLGHPSALGLSRAVRIDFEVSNSFVSVPGLVTARVQGTTNALSDGRVLIAGGGTGFYLFPVPKASTEIFDPLTRTMQAGPAMSVSRTFHTATTLLDGRVLIAGGAVDLTPGTVTASADIYDPATGVMIPTAPMGTVRVAHTATLLQDGRVLVAGGTSVPPTSGLAAASNAALNTAEIYDPVTGMWNPVANLMQSTRMMSSAVRLPDDRVLLISGVSGLTTFFGVDIPAYTASCDYFDPATNLLVSAPSIGSSNSRGGHSALLHPGTGKVLVAGGFRNVGFFPPTPTPVASTRVFSGGIWSSGPSLPAAAAVPAMVLQQDGDMLIAGGANGALPFPGSISNCVLYDGTSLLTRTPLPAPGASQGAVLLPDGAILMVGGADLGLPGTGGSAVTTAYLYTPAP